MSFSSFNIRLNLLAAVALFVLIAPKTHAEATDAPPAIETVEDQSESPELMTKSLIVTRYRGDVYIDGQRIETKHSTEGDWRVDLVSKLEGINFQRPADFSRWARKLRGQRVFQYETVSDSDGGFTPIALVSNERRESISENLKAHRSRIMAQAMIPEREFSQASRQSQFSPSASIETLGLSRYLVSLQPHVQNNYNAAFAGARLGPLGALHFPTTQPTNRVLVSGFDSGEVIRKVQGRYPGFQITGVRNLTSSN